MSNLRKGDQMALNNNIIMAQYSHKTLLQVKHYHMENY